jgi:hypothetical protein
MIVSRAEYFKDFNGNPRQLESIRHIEVLDQVAKKLWEIADLEKIAISNNNNNNNNNATADKIAALKLILETVKHRFETIIGTSP